MVFGGEKDKLFPFDQEGDQEIPKAYPTLVKTEGLYMPVFMYHPTTLSCLLLIWCRTPTIPPLQM